MIKEPLHVYHILLQVGPRVKAYMARPARGKLSEDYGKSNLCANCGVTMTITGSLADTTDVTVVEKTVVTDMADVDKSHTYLHKDIFYEKPTRTRRGSNSNYSCP